MPTCGMSTVLRMSLVQMSSGESESATMAAAKAAGPRLSNTNRRLSGSMGPRTLRCWRRGEEAASSGRTRDCLREDKGWADKSEKGT